MGSNLETAVNAAFKAAENLLEAGSKISTSFLKLLSSGTPGVLGGVMNWTANASAGGDCACHIPPPCWMPRILRQIVGYGVVGNEASLTFVITNESMAARSIKVFTTTPTAGLSLSSTTATLAAMARRHATIPYPSPTGTTGNPGADILLWDRAPAEHSHRSLDKFLPVWVDAQQNA